MDERKKTMKITKNTVFAVNTTENQIVYQTKENENGFLGKGRILIDVNYPVLIFRIKHDFLSKAYRFTISVNEDIKSCLPEKLSPKGILGQSIDIVPDEKIRNDYIMFVQTLVCPIILRWYNILCMLEILDNINDGEEAYLEQVCSSIGVLYKKNDLNWTREQIGTKVIKDMQEYEEAKEIAQYFEIR